MLDLSGYKLTFDDEFNGLSASPTGVGTIWETAYFWGGRTLGGPDFYLDSSVGRLGRTPFSVSGGVLTIHSECTTSDLQAAGVTQPFTTGQIDTHSSFSQEYGYFEMRAKISNTYGVNSAFWLMPVSGPWPPEIDIAEILGREPNTLYMTNHTDSANPTSIGGVSQATDFSKDFHTYGVLWTPTTLTFYVDGQAAYETPTQPDEHQPMYILATLGVGGSWPGNPTAQNFAADYQIDYIRAYSSDPAAKSVTPQPGYVPQYGVGGSTALPMPAAIVIGTGSDSLVITVNEDTYNGDAQFTVAVDGKQIGGTQTTTALRSGNQTQAFTFKGDWGVGQHAVTVTFLNDAYGGTATTDRNLYVTGMSYNGTTYAANTAPLMGAGPVSFQVTDLTAPPLTIAAGNGQTVTTQAGSARTVNITGSAKVNAKGNDAINCGTGTATIRVNPGNVTVSGNTSGALSFINSGVGSSTLNLKGGRTSAVFGAGGATVNIAGNVDLRGGTGAELYNLISDASIDTATIYGFKTGTDHLHLVGYGIGPARVTSVTDGTAGTLVKLADGSSAMLMSVHNTNATMLFV